MYTSDPILDDVSHHETQVIARTLQYPELKKQLKLEPDWFWDPRKQAIVEKIMNDEGFDKEKLMTASIQDADKYGDVQFIHDLINYGVASGSESEHLSDQRYVLTKYVEREVDKAINDYQQEQSTDKQIELSNQILRLNKLNLGDGDEKFNVLTEIMDDLHTEKHRNIIKTGFDRLDEIIGGFERQQLNIVAARPSIGKSAFALELGQNLANNGAEVLFYSIESSVKNITQRALSALSRVGLYKFKEPKRLMSSDEVDKVMDAIHILFNKNLNIVEQSEVTPNMIRRAAHNMPEDKHCFIIIDYMQLMKSDIQHKSKYEETSHISRELKIITQEFPHITLIPIAQLNRGVESRNDKRPMMSDLRESGQLEQDASMITMLYRDDYYNPPEEYKPGAPSPLEVIVTKNKDGEIGTATLDFYKNIQRIY
ncbi:DnaB-like helicase C-terminal domain-containing protein [Salinicoccus albus]|uniref:DnaB-like helicase C-terminal domain-containing protein n=1 Tax=Salinicoccus albus TaxID=418756 RepID=UPI000360D07A|nr:DnaB-like helicase C-terminal domain-containing protein [Salinicoccus albus]